MFTLQSTVRVCFHERRLQYMEKEQLDSWMSTRPGERILDIGAVCLSFLAHLSTWSKSMSPSQSESYLVNTLEVTIIA